MCNQNKSKIWTFLESGRRKNKWNQVETESKFHFRLAIKKENWNRKELHVSLTPKTCFHLKKWNHMESKNLSKKWVVPSSNYASNCIYWFHLPSKELEQNSNSTSIFLESESIDSFASNSLLLFLLVRQDPKVLSLCKTRIQLFLPSQLYCTITGKGN